MYCKFGGLGFRLSMVVSGFVGVWRRAGDLDRGFGKYSDTSD